ncbi:hypothetical protein NUITMVS1_42310 [Shewanella xiamenensis]|nr:hypothetical protein NUITMVS1_42310 [Shewanella xiamenensis]BDQ68294.1 hypothetical protein NUITMVS2_41070 [Shewanella xiamenensis]GLD79216.1 hypothetical protein NUITMVS3_36500 [Shewanella xiamenensis]
MNTKSNDTPLEYVDISSKLSKRKVTKKSAPPNKHRMTDNSKIENMNARALINPSLGSTFHIIVYLFGP